MEWILIYDIHKWVPIRILDPFRITETLDINLNCDARSSKVIIQAAEESILIHPFLAQDKS